MLKGWVGIWPKFLLIPTVNAKLITQIYMKVKATQHLHQGKIGLQFNKMCGNSLLTNEYTGPSDCYILLLRNVTALQLQYQYLLKICLSLLLILKQGLKNTGRERRPRESRLCTIPESCRAISHAQIITVQTS